MLKLIVTLLVGIVTGSIITLAATTMVLPGPQAVNAAPALPVAGQDVTINVSRNYLSSQVVEGLQEAHLPVPLQDVNVELRPGSVLAISARTGTPLVKMNVSALFKLSVSDGRLVAHATDVRIGGLAVDRFVGDALEQRVNDRLADLTKDTSVHVQSVDTTTSGLEIQATIPHS